MKRRHIKDIVRKIFVLSIGIVVLYIFLMNLIGYIVHSKKEVIVPNITYKSLAEAVDIVSKMGLSIKKIGESYNPQYPAGTVLVQQPQAGMVVREGRTINVILSLGGEKVFVPDIIGEDLRKAEIILRQYSLFVGTVTERYSLRYAKNKVMEQQPIAGEIVDKNSYVSIVVSAGLPQEDVILVPDFLQKNINEVYTWAQKYGIEVKVSEQLLPEIPEGTVIQQQPVADSIVVSSTTLTVVIAKHTTQDLQKQSEYNFEYELPFISDAAKNVKIVQISAEGENILYNRLTLPKEKIRLYIPPKKNSKIRIFVDNVLIDER